ncbi:NAD(P)/FAD-dependent oxidoreductase [Novipirellula artificiosorum]|nr:FAD-dependent monooxygenase [Novipirellula artificiosorum]
MITKATPSNCRFRVLVIGGGIAGSTCALRLAHHGIHVELVERLAFPRSKACGCCLGAAGLRLLDRLSLADAVRDLGTPTNRWVASLGTRRVEIPIPAGLAISREALDPLLLNAAQNAGAIVMTETSGTVRQVESDGVDVELRGRASVSQRRFDIVVVAAGLSAGGLSKVLPWSEQPHGPFGVSCTIEDPTLQPNTIYMACDDDGYVGMVRLADGRVDVAAALRSGSQANLLGNPLIRMQQILSRSCFDLPTWKDPSVVSTTPPLRRTRQFGNGPVLAIGDAAVYVEPFTGEGMTWALAGGIAAADLISVSGDSALIGQAWQRQLTNQLRTKLRLCRTVTTACRSQAVRRTFGELLTHFPSLAQPLVNRLS